MDKTPFLLPIFAFGIFVLIFAVAHLARARRKQAMIASGAEMGFVPATEASPAIAEIPLFKGRRGSFRLIMQGAAGGCEAWIFDYGYMRGKAQLVQTVVAFKNSGMKLPVFEVHPKGFFDSIRSALGNKIVKFPITNPFADRFTVIGEDSEAIQRIFTPELQNYMEGLPQTGWTIEGSHDTLALYRPGKTAPASALRTFVDEASAVAQSLIAFVSSKGQRFGA